MEKLKDHQEMSTETSTDLFQKTNALLQKYQNFLFPISLILALFTSLLVFDLKISVGLDDSWYVSRAIELFRDGIYPSAKGDVYHWFLGFFISIFGVNLIFLKLLSCALMIGFFIIFYKTFKTLSAPTLLFSTLAILSVSSYLLHYSGQLYTEALFMFLNIAVFYYFFRFVEKLGTRDADLRSDYRDWLIIGFLLFLVFSTRFIGLVIIIAIALFFIVERKPKAAGLAVLSFLTFRIPFSTIKSLIWEPNDQFGNKFTSLLYKDHYDHSTGTENIIGFVDRFVLNSYKFMGDHFTHIVGLGISNRFASHQVITIILYLIFLVCFIVAIKRKNKVFTFLGIYTATAMSITFVIMETQWGQMRLIVPFAPYLILFLLYGIYELLTSDRFKKLQIVFLTLVGLAILSVTYNSIRAIRTNLPELSTNLLQNEYFGYEHPWVNYLKMCRWTEDNLEANSVVGSIDQNLAHIYSNGVKYHWLDDKSIGNAGEFLAYLKANNISHITQAPLSENPRRKDDLTLNPTMQEYISTSIIQYPEQIKLLHSIGDTSTCRLYTIVHK